MQKCISFTDLNKCPTISISLQPIGFDTAENEPSQVCSKGSTLYNDDDWISYFRPKSQGKLLSENQDGTSLRLCDFAQFRDMLGVAAAETDLEELAMAAFEMPLLLDWSAAAKASFCSLE